MGRTFARSNKPFVRLRLVGCSRVRPHDEPRIILRSVASSHRGEPPTGANRMSTLVHPVARKIGAPVHSPWSARDIWRWITLKAEVLRHETREKPLASTDSMLTLWDRRGCRAVGNVVNPWRGALIEPRGLRNAHKCGHAPRFRRH